MRAQVMVLLGICLAATPAVAKKSNPKASPAALAPEVVQKRVALLEPPPAKGVPKAAAKWSVFFASQELKEQGFDVIEAKAVATAHAKVKQKVPACGDEAACLAGVAKTAGAGYMANVTVRPAGKQLGVKMTLVDAEDAKIVSNIFTLVFDSSPKTIRAAIQKQVPRVAAALKQHIEGKAAARQAVAVVDPKPADSQPEPTVLAPKPEDPKIGPVEAQPGLATVGPGTAEPQPALVSKPQDPPAVSALTPKLEEKPAAATVRAVEASSDEPNALATKAAPASTTPGISQENSPGAGVLPYAMLGVGAVATGVGIGLFGLQANDAVADFQAGRDPEKARDAAKSKALLVDVTAGAGVALMVAGGALLLFAGDDEPAAGSLSVAPTATTNSFGAAVSGSF